MIAIYGTRSNPRSEEWILKRETNEVISSYETTWTFAISIKQFCLNLDYPNMGFMVVPTHSGRLWLWEPPRSYKLTEEDSDSRLAFGA